MEVLSVIHYPVFGGPHNRNTKVAPVLKEWGINTTVLLPDEPGNAAQRLRTSGVEVIEMPLSRIRATRSVRVHLRLLRNFWREVREVRRVIRERDIDVVQINGLVNAQAAIAAKLEGIPVVWQILDTFPPMWLRGLLMPLVLLLADTIMSTGIKVAHDHPGAIRKRDKLITFFPPVDLDRFRNDQATRQQARQALGLKANDLVIGNVSNLNPAKGHLTFVRAAGLVKRQFPNVRFVILGASYAHHADYANSVREEAKARGLRVDEDLIIADPEGRVADLEPAFDIFWVTSEPRSEGIPTVLEEAMALSLPCVAVDVGSISEIVKEGETGVVVPPRDPAAVAEATLKLLGKKDQLASMGSNARRFAEQHFSVQRCAASHVQAYGKALGTDFGVMDGQTRSRWEG